MTKIPYDRPNGGRNRLVLDLDDLTPAEAAELDVWVDSLREPLPPDETPAHPAGIRRRVSAWAFGRQIGRASCRERV